MKLGPRTLLEPRSPTSTSPDSHTKSPWCCTATCRLVPLVSLLRPTYRSARVVSATQALPPTESLPPGTVPAGDGGVLTPGFDDCVSPGTQGYVPVSMHYYKGNGVTHQPVFGHRLFLQYLLPKRLHRQSDCLCTFGLRRKLSGRNRRRGFPQQHQWTQYFSCIPDGSGQGILYKQLFCLVAPDQ